MSPSTVAMFAHFLRTRMFVSSGLGLSSTFAMSKMDTSLQVWLGNVPTGASPSEAKAEIASHGYVWPHFVKVLKSKHVGNKLMNCIFAMPSTECATELLTGFMTWSNGKHVVTRPAFADKKPAKGESAEAVVGRWTRYQLLLKVAQLEATQPSSSSPSLPSSGVRRG